VRYPGKETRLWYLVPSLDIVVLLGAFALLAARGRRVPPFVHVALAVGFVLLRLLRVADGVSMRFLRRPFDLYLNLSLLPEVPRLLRETVPLPTLVLGTLGGLAALVGVFLLTLVALRRLEVALAHPTHVRILGGVTAFFLVASLVPRAQADERFTGAFASSGVGRFVAEGSAVVEAQRCRERQERAIAAARARLASIPTNLSKLHGVDVLLFIVESYGEAVLEEPALTRRILPELAELEAELGSAGYVMASQVLDSSTFGGKSWLAHASLNTGVRTENQLEYELLTLRHPLTLASFFRDAGYWTVLVQPATKRITLAQEYLDFDKKYFAATFDYQGPSFGWNNLPDQYSVDFVDRRETNRERGATPRTPDRPRFIEYALISSHAPWSRQATLLRDWDRIGNGAIFGELPIREHLTAWSELGEGADAYVDSLVYDLEVLRRYLVDRVKDDTLVIILGDHQPPGGVTGSSVGDGVPVHVLSRRAALVEPFVARGYVGGMRPGRSGPRQGLETFLFSFLRDFSADLRQTSAVGGHSP